jgi:hypothetical protein
MTFKDVSHIHELRITKLYQSIQNSQIKQKAKEMKFSLNNIIESY